MEMIESRSTRLRKSHKAQSVLRTLSAIAIGLALVFGLLLGWFSPVYIADPSMAPTLKKDETVLYDRLYKHFFTLRRSDMVVFRDPQTGALLIKRIVGLAGETVSAEDGMLLINEQYMLSEYDYLSPGFRSSRQRCRTAAYTSCPTTATTARTAAIPPSAAFRLPIFLAWCACGSTGSPSFPAVIEHEVL